MVFTRVFLLLGTFFAVRNVSAVPLASVVQQETSNGDLSQYFGRRETREVPEYEIVHPWRLSRTRRSVEDAEEKAKDAIEYLFSAFEEDFHLALDPVYDLFSDSSLVQHTWKNGSRLGAPKSCYYQGVSLNHDGSTAYASTCSGGLTATVRTTKADYHIQPLKEDHALKFAKSEQPPAHIVNKEMPTMSHCAMEEGEQEKNFIDRKKRSVDDLNTKFLEVYVVADETVKQEYGDNTEFYLMSMLNQVAGLYKDETLGADIRLHVGKLEILEESLPELSLDDNIEGSLRRFCAWQNKQNADVSLLITRRDMAFGSHYEVTGNSYDIGAACNTNKRCTIAEDHGPSGLVFTVAHELAHLLGVSHDGTVECEDNGNIMSPHDTGGMAAFKWSECSRNSLQQWLSSESASCLDNAPLSSSKYFLSRISLPGFHFDADFQCQATYHDDNAVVADKVKDSEDICNELACDYGSMSLVSNNIPPLDGTSCGFSKACIRGSCMDLRSKLDCGGGECPAQYIAGTWSSCGDTCFQSRQVLCAELHDDGSTVLVDSADCAQLDAVSTGRCCCDTGSCSVAASPDARYQWLATVWSSCSATCGNDAVQTRIVTCYDSQANLPTDVQELCEGSEQPADVQACTGLPACTTSTRYQWIIGSFAACSVTCGGGTQARAIACFDPQINNIVSDEVCTTNIGARPTAETRECNTQSCQTVAYEYTIGTWGQCSVSCGSGFQTRTVYCREVGVDIPLSDSPCTTQGLTKPDVVQSCNLQACTATTYEFYTGAWGSCSATCGGGVQTRTVNCAVQGTNGATVVSDTFCTQAGLTKPTGTQVCNSNTCAGNFIYITGQWGGCSATCGLGTQTRSIVCFDVASNALTSDTSCVNAGATRPATTQQCPNLPACPTITYEYFTGSYGTCSATCGGGTQTRVVYCRVVGTFTEVDNNLCLAQGLVKPNEVQVCNTNACSSSLVFVPGTWGQCSATCGVGTQTRPVACIDTAANAVRDESACLAIGLTQPLTTQVCPNLPSCPTGNYAYNPTLWTGCSVTCGSGIQTRTYTCINVDTSSVVDNSNCVNAGLSTPDITQPCPGLPACPVYQYLPGEWGSCSATCGSGTQTRTVSCIDTTTSTTVAMSLCDGLSMPDTTQACENLPVCPVYDYSVGAWGFCSVTCDGGVQSRTVECIEVTNSNTVVSDTLCDAAGLTKPIGQQNCNEESCQGGDVFIYITSVFGDCDCITYTQTRAVQCVQLTANSVRAANDAQCDSLNQVKPDATQECVPPPNTCEYTWKATTWTPCSVTCGEGERTRYVFCASDVDNAIVGDELCQAEKLPELEVCDTGIHCPKNYYWLPGDWSECSATCGDGAQTREADCYTLNGIIRKVNDSFCEADESLPELVRPCNLRPCQGIWVGTRYSPCSVTCGVGTQTRQVDCRLGKEDEEVLPDGDCVGDKPPTERECVLEACPQPYGCGVTHFAESGILTSPNYPNNYPNDMECFNTILNADTYAAFLEADGDYINENHLQLTFTAFNLEDSKDCEYDHVLIKDHYSQEVTRLCGELDELPYTHYAAGDAIDVTFFSDLSTNDRGYNLTWEMVPNSTPYFLTGNWSECSAVCGEGVERREIVCMQYFSPVDMSMCEGLTQPRPSDSRPCQGLPPCPPYDDVCNKTLTNETSVFSPGYIANYDDDTICDTRIMSEDMCVSLTFDFLDIEPSPNCERDYVEFRDNTNAAFTQRFCGRPDPLPTWLSSSGDVSVRFHSNMNRDGRGYTASIDFVSCPEYLYSSGPWSECSAVCDGGDQTREVLCLSVEDNSVHNDFFCLGLDKPEDTRRCNEQPCSPCNGVITLETPEYELFSPNYPRPYSNNDRCDVTIVNPNPNQCLRFTFLSFDVQEGSRPGVCDRDSLQLIDLGNDALTVTHCGQITPPTFISTSSLVRLVFTTDDRVVGNGADINIRYEDCAQFYYRASTWSDCDATCGEGTRTRTIMCFNRDTNTEVAMDQCVGLRPRETEICNEEPCQDQCDQDIRIPNQVINSPNYPSNYFENETCTVQIRNPNGCISLSVLDFELEAGSTCENDYLEVKDTTFADHGGVFCGTDHFTSWTSFSGSVELNFESNGEEEYRGYSIFETFVDCPKGEFDVGEWSRCSARCDGGERTRSVRCLTEDNEVIPDPLCHVPKPPTTEPCNETPCVKECDRNVTAGLDMIDYTAEDYQNNSNCLITITNPAGGCINLIFIRMDIEPGSAPEVCDNDYLEIDDLARSGPAPRLCGAGIGLPILSVGSTVELTFHTNGDDTRSGFQIFPQLYACATFSWDVGTWGECDVTCGGGQRIRSVTCRNDANNQPDEDSLCAGTKPAVSESCNTDPCPECDRNVTTATLIEFKNEDYINDLDCEIRVINNAGCMELVFISLNFEAGSAPNVCDRDYLEIDDEGNAALAPRYCGSNFFPANFQSVSGSVVLRIHTNSAVTGNGFQLFPRFNTCPQYSWDASEWSVCDATCEGGTRTRTVSCVETVTSTPANEALCLQQKPAESESCNNFPCPGCDRNVSTGALITFTAGDYENDLDCEITITSDRCVQLVFISMDIEAGSAPGVCDNDYLEVDDTGRPGVQSTLCGTQTPPVWQSVGDTVILTMHTNEAVTGNGFQVFPQDTECPQYSWDEGAWGECDVTCDGGTRTRTVSCVETVTSTPANDALCLQQKPAESESCNETPCPTCDRNVTTGEMISFTAGDYENDLDCEITITSDRCVQLIFVSMDIQAGSAPNVCDNDYVEVNDLDRPGPGGRYKLCGTQTPPIWSSVGDTVVLSIHTNEAVTGNGFQVFPQDTECPQYSWDVGAWGECDVTCGGGTRMRNVTCVETGTLTEADEALCLQTKPVDSESCNDTPCPSCDSTVTTQQFTRSPNQDLGQNYGNNENCTTTINAPSGQCVRLTFISFNVQPGSAAGLCDNDYVQITDLDYPEQTDTLCGSNSRTFISRSENVEIVFISDDSVTAPGFQVYNTFTACSQFLYVTGDWSECDATCGGGQRIRDVKCRRLSDNTEVNPSNCDLSAPPATQPCNLDPCPVCGQSFSTSFQYIQSTNYPSAYPANQDCSYNITNDVACVSIVFLALNLESSVSCSKDYLEVQDANYPELNERYCGSAVPNPWVSSSGEVDIIFHSDGDTEGTGYFLQESFVACPVYDWVTGSYGACSVTCGGGLSTRTVECRNVQTNAQAPAESLCENAKPSTTEACGLDDCEIDCDATITQAGALESYNRPSNYVDDLDCVTTITNNAGCIYIIFTSFDVEGGSSLGTCDNDYLTIEDDTYGLAETYCGTLSPLPTYQSNSGSVIVTFHSNNNTITRPGYQAFATFNTCPQYGWVTGSWSACSATCEGGTQTRSVSCVNTQTNAAAPTDELCTNAKPTESQACNTQTCLCGQTLTNTNGGGLQSPGYGSAYPNDFDCVNTVLNTQGECVRIIFISVNIQDGTIPGSCDRDYLELTDTSGTSPTTKYCGSTVPTPWESTGSTVSIRFVSDSSVTATGYYIFYSFIACPDNRWQTSVWGTCSLTCGGGVQIRTVTCEDNAGNTVADSLCDEVKPDESQACNTNACPTRYQWQSVPSTTCSVTCGGGIQTMIVLCKDIVSSNTVNDALCTEQKPSTTSICNTDPCPNAGIPSCGSTVPATTTTGTIQSPNYPSNYPNDQDCLITFELPANTRLKFSIEAFDVEQGTSVRCEKDYLKFEATPSGNAALYCQQYILPVVWESSAGDNSVTVQFYSDASGTDTGYTATWEHIV